MLAIQYHGHRFIMLHCNLVVFWQVPAGSLSNDERVTGHYSQQDMMAWIEKVCHRGWACEKHESMYLNHIFIMKIFEKCLRMDIVYHWDTLGQPHTITVIWITWTNIFYSLQLRWEVLNEVFEDGVWNLIPSQWDEVFSLRLIVDILLIKFQLISDSTPSEICC